MRVLIRTLSQAAAGAAESRERVFDGEAITFGRASDQILHCNDRAILLNHARIGMSAGRVRLACLGSAQASVNGRVCRDAVLELDDAVQMGPVLIRRLAAPEGFDLCLQVETQSSSTSTDIEPPALTLGSVGWRKRPWAWAGFLAALGLGLLLPWVGLTGDAGGVKSLRAWNLPSDTQWMSGPLHSAHANLEQECEACHVEPFARVRNESCLDCHASNLHQHVAADHPAADALVTERCASCHLEHEEPTQLVLDDSRVCTDCHAAPLEHGAREGALAVTDFATNHPPFAVNELKKDESGLKFPHDAHLDPRGVKGPQGNTVMGCADCHRPEPGGARFLAIEMERDCSSCHTLDFDPATPERRLPHAEPELVLQALVDHYSTRYLTGYADTQVKPGRVALPPAVDVAPAARARLLGQARERALGVAKDVFERRVCSDCHTVTRDDSSGTPGWKIAPVELVQAWMPDVRFPHAAHGTELTPCKTCHAAESSKQSTDVLMPAIDTCRDCHAGESGQLASGPGVTSTCVSCHQYHRPEQPLWPPVVQQVLRKAAIRP